MQVLTTLILSLALSLSLSLAPILVVWYLFLDPFSYSVFLPLELDLKYYGLQFLDSFRRFDYEKGALKKFSSTGRYMCTKMLR